MKILHTSDWHLGRRFHNVSLLEDQEHIIEQIIAQALTHQVDAVLIAGDIYDRAIPPTGAIALLDDTLHTLAEVHNIPVLMISGNHDSHERLSFARRQLAARNIHLFCDIQSTAEPVIITSRDNSHSMAIYGAAYHTPEQVRATFDVAVKTFDDAHSFLIDTIDLSKSPADFNILMSHCFVAGGESSDSERPLAIGGADTVSATPMEKFDYVALGHLHGPQKRVLDKIRYSGSPLKYSFSEVTQKKSTTLVEFTKDAEPIITQLPLIPLRDVQTLTGELNTLLADADASPCKNDYLAITLTDKHAILDAMTKLRAHYPNVLQLEKTFLQTQKSNDAPTTVLTPSKNTAQLFADFYEEVQGEAMNEAQTQYLTEVLQQLRDEERSQ